MSKYKVDDVICFAGDRNAKVKVIDVCNSSLRYRLKSLKSGYMYWLQMKEVDINYMYICTEKGLPAQQSMPLQYHGVDKPYAISGDMYDKVKGLYCSCDNRQEILNHAMGNTFKYCTNCKKEIS